MTGARILLSCLLLVVVGCTTGARVQTPQVDPEIGVLTYGQAVARMKRPPDYKYEEGEWLVAAWIDHWTETEDCGIRGTTAITPMKIPHGQHTHLVFDRETKRLKREWVYQWP